MVAPVPLRERRAFVNSSAYLALLDATDRYHTEAQVIARALADARYRQFTTNALIIEAHALILAELGIASAARFLRGVDASNTVVVRVRATDESRAKQVIYHFDDKDFS